MYGSRAQCTSRPQSDLDLVVFATPDQRERVGDLREAFDESNLPFRVDLFVWDEVPESFREQIQADHVTLVGGRERASAVTRSSECMSDGWTQYRLVELCDITRGASPRPIHSWIAKDGTPWVKIADATATASRYIDQTRECIRRAGQSKSVTVFPGDLILSNSASPGIPKFMNIEACIHDGWLLLRNFRGLDRLFAYYLLLFERSDLVGKGTGSVFTNLKTETLKQHEVTVPNLAEQRTIAYILGTLDDKIELNRRMNATLEAMARALFKSWFVDFDPVRAKMEGRDTALPKEVADLFPDRLVDSELGEIPEGWAVRTLGDLCHKPQYGHTASAKSLPVGPQFLRITDINKESWITWSRVPFCEATNDEFLKYQLKKGELLIARMADPGHGVLIEEDVQAVFASYLIRFKPIDSRHARLLQYWLNSDTYWQLVRGQSAGTTRVSLNAKVLSLFSLVVPPGAVASRFAASIDALRDRLVNSAKEMQVLATIRETLIPKLVSGQLRVNGLAQASEPGERPESAGAHET
ncbi:MAG: restriction endonuclease subunit S [Bryobacterales bacterium]|nr:restriction endonuclease subunit S [Bryobacterales bacterium]